MSDLSVTLFPHTWITSQDLTRIASRFKDINICIPWLMDIPSILHNNDGHIRVQILRPASDQRPKGNFKGLLAEYKLWMRQHEDKGLHAFLSSCQKSGRSEEASWEIRQLIRRMGQGESSDPEDSLALKWHLILHLARESEENRIQAEQMLMDLKSKKSPLAEALEDDTSSSGIFNDLPVFGSQPLMDKHLIRPVLEAWIGLFGSYIPDEGIFITLNKDIIDYMEEIFEDNIIRDPGQEKIYIPSLQDKRVRLKEPFLADICGKTIILL